MLKYKGDFSRLSMLSFYEVPNKNELLIGKDTADTNFRIFKMTLTAPP